MNILYISSEKIPGSHGGSVHVWEVAKNLAELGNEVYLLSNYEKNLDKEENFGKIKVLRTNMYVSRFVLQILGIKEIKKLLSLDYDVIIERVGFLSGVGTILSILKRKPLVLEVNSPIEEVYSGRLKGHSILSRLVLIWRDVQFKQARKIIAPLETLAEDNLHKFERVDWGANIRIFDPSLKNSETAKKLVNKYHLKGKKIVVYIGSLRRWHDIPTLLSAIPPVCRDVEDAVFLFIGENPEEKELVEKIKEKTMEMGVNMQCLFAGRQPYSLIPYFLAISHIGVAPFSVEKYLTLKQFGFYWSPLKIFEYMASGLPVVTTDYPELVRILGNGSCGMTYREKNSKELASVLVKLLKNEKLRIKLGGNARKRVVERYSWQRHCQRLKQIFEEVIKN